MLNYFAFSSLDWWSHCQAPDEPRGFARRTLVRQASRFRHFTTASFVQVIDVGAKK
jgi:hypothetical protein